MLFTKREKVLVACIAVLIIAVSGLLFRGSGKEDVVIDLNETNPIALPQGTEPVETVPEETDEEIAVYITGEVLNPGVYKVLTSTRMEEVIFLAGGAKEGADLEQVNLARRVTDEEMIVVPKIGEEVSEIAETNTQEGNDKGKTVSSKVSNGKVNINKAGAEELDTLPGIGPAYAKRIIDYRNNSGSFKTIEEIQNVSGIGPKTFEKLKDKIRVN